MNVYVFADEAGNFDFSSHRSASKYFTIASITLADCSVGDALLELRRDLAWRGEHLTKEFHATDDPQAVRDEVFAVIAAADFRIDATLLEKSKAYDYLRSDMRLYKDRLVSALQTRRTADREQGGQVAGSRRRHRRETAARGFSRRRA